ncbi:hypothetical protein AN958_10782 [Leucoagaricus sp. SymC.cos]|nr:hypothetical protein AN958_10782 [Leucoagaricus sp. SymC.cos]
MTEPQPVVISLLKLPPEIQPFFRLKEILLVFREKLDHLTLALAHTQDPNAHVGLAPKFHKALVPLHGVAADQATALVELLVIAQSFAEKMLNLVDALPITFTGPERPRVLASVTSYAKSMVRVYGRAEQGMKEVIQVTMSTVEKLKAMLDHSGTLPCFFWNDSNQFFAASNSSEASVFTEENSQVVNELIQAAREACSLLHQGAQYYQTAQKHFQNVELSQEQMPSPDEIGTVRQRWVTFSKDLSSFNANRELAKIGVELRGARTARETISMGQFTALFGKRTAQARPDARTGLRAIPEAGASDAASTSSPPPPSYRRSFLRSVLQRLLPCIFPKQNS